MLANQIRTSMRMTGKLEVRIKCTGYNNIYPLLQVLDRIPSSFPDEFVKEKIERITNTDTYIVGYKDSADGTTKQPIYEDKIYFGIRAILTFKKI